jgi:EF hand
VSIEEFVKTLLGEINSYRLNIIKQAFATIDTNKNGEIDFEEVKARFDPTRHPDVVNGTRSVDDVRFEFLDMFSTHHNIENGFQADKTVTL